VIGVKGDVQPCFFIAGPAGARTAGDVASVLNSDSMIAQRENIRAGRREECTRCVCSLYRESGDFGELSLR
jgi:hypothetical protein